MADDVRRHIETVISSCVRSKCVCKFVNLVRHWIMNDYIHVYKLESNDVTNVTDELHVCTCCFCISCLLITFP